MISPTRKWGMVPEAFYLVSIQKPPLPRRERVGVRGSKTDRFEILNLYHPRSSLLGRLGGKNGVSGWGLTRRSEPEF